MTGHGRGEASPQNKNERPHDSDSPNNLEMNPSAVRDRMYTELDKNIVKIVTINTSSPVACIYLSLFPPAPRPRLSLR